MTWKRIKNPLILYKESVQAPIQNWSTYLSSTRHSILLPAVQDVLFCTSRSILSSLVWAQELIPVDSINQVSLYSDFSLDSDEGRHQKEIEGWGEGEVGMFFIRNPSPQLWVCRSSVPTSVEQSFCIAKAPHLDLNHCPWFSSSGGPPSVVNTQCFTIPWELSIVNSYLYNSLFSLPLLSAPSTFRQDLGYYSNSKKCSQHLSLH